MLYLTLQTSTRTQQTRCKYSVLPFFHVVSNSAKYTCLNKYQVLESYIFHFVFSAVHVRLHVTTSCSFCFFPVFTSPHNSFLFLLFIFLFSCLTFRSPVFHCSPPLLPLPPSPQPLPLIIFHTSSFLIPE